MARKRRTSAVLEAARQRLAGLKKITPAADFGGTLNPLGFQAVITDFTTELDSYNQNNAALDEQQNRVDTKEDTLNDYNKRILSAVEAHHGPDSSEYEMVGGTRLSERKKGKARSAGGSKPPTS